MPFAAGAVAVLRARMHDSKVVDELDVSLAHFHVQLVSDKFRGQTKVERQRDVAKLLKDLLQTRVHALQLHTFTPEEYAKRH